MSSRRPAPPGLARRLIALTLPRRHRATCLSDLDERHESLADKAGRGAARRWYWRQAASFVARVPLERLRRPDRSSARAPGATGNGQMLATATSARGFHLRVFRTLAAFGRELHVAARALRRRPGFTIPAVIVLALAIGANAAILSIVDNVLLRGLPVADPDEVVFLWDLVPPGERRDRRLPLSYPTYRAWKQRDDLFKAVVAFDTASPTIATDDRAIAAEGLIVAAETFDFLGARPQIGRTFRAADGEPDAAPVAVISHRLWQRDFGADPNIVGRVVSMDSVATTVVGVMPAGFWFFDPYGFVRAGAGRITEQPDFWQPLVARDWNAYGDSPVLRVMARLADGVSPARASEAAGVMRSALARGEARTDIEFGLTSLEDEVRGEKRGRLLLLQAAATLLLLIACVNLMSLLFAKATTTRAEIAVRAALGAGRASLVRLAVGEALLLGIAGGVVGLLAARSLTGLILSIAPRDLPLAHRVAVDGRVALITMGAAIIAGVVAGAMPALRLDFGALTRALGSGYRTVAGDSSASRTRSTLVALEVALSLVLLIGATIMLRSFIGTWSNDPGFERESVLTYFVRLATPPGEEPDYTFHNRLLDAVRELPGVEAAGGTTHLPFTNWGIGWPIATDDRTTMEDAPRVDGRWITETYLDTMKIGLRAGRDFTAEDTEASEPVILVNEAFVEEFLDDAHPTSVIGRLVHVGLFGPTRFVKHRIVGVVENVRTGRLYEDPRPLVYQASRRRPTVYLRHVVRTAGNPSSLAEPIRQLAAEILPGQPIAEVYPLRALLADSLAEERFYTQLLTAFGSMAFALAAIGIYGSVAYTTRLQLREIGVRIAFGARPRAVRRMIVARGLFPVAIGVVLGCIGAIGLVRGLSHLLHDVSPIDPVSFAAGAGVFLGVAAIAAFLPARRAAAVNPIDILRAD